MTTRQQELESLGTEFEKREAGFAELTEFYEKVEAIYAQASAFMSGGRGSYVSDSTNTVSRRDLGRNPVNSVRPPIRPTLTAFVGDICGN